MRVKKVHTVPKEVDYPQSNEDFFNMQDKGISCALSDGASESYDSKTWATFLCQTFIDESKKKLIGKFYRHKQLNNLIVNSRLKFFDFFSHKTLTWSQEAAFNRGSFASLLGLIDHGNTIEILAIGDSIALWQNPDSSVQTYFLTDVSEFAKQPLLISTNNSLDDDFFMQENVRWSCKKIKKKDILNGSIFLMTDAIAVRILDFIKNGQINFAKNLITGDYNKFENWLLLERKKKQIKTDDTTVVWINTHETS